MRTRLFILAAVLATFGSVTLNGFLTWDDTLTLSQNPRLKPPTLANTLYYWNHGELELYLPLTYTLWSLTAVFSHRHLAGEIALVAWPFHLLNLLAHCISSLVVFELLRRLTPRPAAAVLGTLVFALHPLQAEAVAWASGFKDVLSGMLGLLAILLCLQTDRKWNTLAASSAFALALLAKPGAICAIPIAAVLLHFTSRFTFSVTARRLAVWCVLAIGALCIAQHVQQVTPIAGDSIALRPLVAADALAFYLWKFIWPFNLSSDYGRTPITVISEGWLAWTWVLPATAAIAVLMARRRIPLLMPAGLVGLCGISLMLGIVRFNFQRYSTVADHYTYLAMLGPAIAAAALIQIIEPAGVRIAAVGVTLLAIRCAHQVTYWRDNLTFFAHAVAVNPTSSMSHISYGVALGSSGELHGAISQFHQAIELAPASEMARDDLAFAHSTLASRFVAKGDLQGAVAEFRAALFVKPDFPLASEGLRQTLDQLRASTTLPAP